MHDYFTAVGIWSKASEATEIHGASTEHGIVAATEVTLNMVHTAAFKMHLLSVIISNLNLYQLTGTKLFVILHIPHNVHDQQV